MNIKKHSPIERYLNLYSAAFFSFFFFVGVKAKQNKIGLAYFFYELLLAAFCQSETGEHGARNINSIKESKHF